MVSKEHLRQQMREAVNDSYEKIPNTGIRLYSTEKLVENCTAVALKHMPQWVKVEDRLPLPIYSTVGKISKYVPFITLDDKEWFGYYDYIGKAWQAQGFKTFRKDEVKSWFNLPTPPKE